MRVSVLLPARDAESTIDAALASVARQSFREFECIVVDDGSRDTTLERSRAMADRDARFRVVAAERRGLLEALRLGLEACRGDLVARMDADDLMHRSRLAAQVEALEESPGLVGVGTHVRFFPRADLTEGMRAYERWLNGIDSAATLRREVFVECPIAHPTLTIRRPVLTRFGYRDAGWPEDYDLVLRLVTAGLALGVVPRRLHLWRDGPERLSRVSARYGQDRFVACKASFLADSFLADHERYVLWGYGRTGRTLARELAARGKRPSAVVELHPGRIGQTILGAPVVRPDALAGRSREPLIASVAGETPRRQIRAALARLGYLEGRDFVCAA